MRLNKIPNTLPAIPILISVLVFLALIFFVLSDDHIKPILQNAQVDKGERWLRTEEFNKIMEEFSGIVNKEDPKIALATLRDEMKINQTLSRSCHPLVHGIGHKAYEKYKDFGKAMLYQDEVCNSGYIHGVIESYFSKEKNIFDLMKTICGEYPEGSFLSWECYHGVGHGLMFYTANDLPKSLTMCESYKGESARSSCFNGVFMENFNTDQKFHVSKFLKDNDLFYPCKDQPNHRKPNCYIYIATNYLSTNREDYKGALKWCDGAEMFYESICVQGVGAQAMKENISNPKFVEKICSSNKKSQVKSCIQGMVGLYINHHGSLEPAKELCEKLEPSNREKCYETIQLNSNTL